MKFQTGLIFGLGTLLSSCGPAVHFEQQLAVSPVGFEQPVGWNLVKNRRYLKNRLVVYEAQDDCCFLRLEVVPEGGDARQMPLDVVADTLTLSRGRDLGLRVGLLESQEIAVADRRAVATTYRMLHGPHSRMGTSVHLRASEYLVILTLQGLDPLSTGVLEQWGRFLDSVRLDDWPAPEEPLFEPESDPEYRIFLGE